MYFSKCNISQSIPPLEHYMRKKYFNLKDRYRIHYHLLRIHLNKISLNSLCEIIHLMYENYSK